MAPAPANPTLQRLQLHAALLEQRLTPPGPGDSHACNQPPLQIPQRDKNWHKGNIYLIGKEEKGCCCQHHCFKGKVRVWPSCGLFAQGPLPPENLQLPNGSGTTGTPGTGWGTQVTGSRGQEQLEQAAGEGAVTQGTPMHLHLLPPAPLNIKETPVFETSAHGVVKSRDSKVTWSREWHMG